MTCAISGLALLLIGLAAKQRWRVPRRHWRALVAASAFNMTLWQVLVGYGLLKVTPRSSSIHCPSGPPS
ncbi:MAG: hypothetical protein ACTSUD_10225 [Alphaproteobacteria bacterium]